MGLRVPSRVMRDLVRFVQSELAALADPELAMRMAAYMKTDMPFYGVQKPARTPVFKEAIHRFPIGSRREYLEAVDALWALPHREEKYFAVGFAKAFPQYVTIGSLPLYRRLISGGAWWDFVDDVAAHLVGRVLLDDRERMRSKMDRWVDDPNMWLRRTAIISQLGHKDDTDEERLFFYCNRRAPEQEFFIRKAIGWALREYAKSAPDAVIRFLRDNGEGLSGLSYREASKHLDM